MVSEIDSATKGVLWGVGILVVFILACALNPIKMVGAGDQVVVFNKFTSKTTVIGTGINFVMPIVNTTKKYSVKVQKSEFNGIEGLSSDSQTIVLNLAVNWRLDGTKLTDIYKNVQGSVEDNIMQNAIIDTSKAELGKFRIDDIAKNRDSLRTAIQNALSARLGSQGVYISNISVTNVDFNDEYDKAINAKMVAQQQALEAKNLKEKKMYESEAKKIENQNLSSSITPLVLKQKWIEKWDGKLPNVMTNENASMLLDIK